MAKRAKQIQTVIDYQELRAEWGRHEMDYDKFIAAVVADGGEAPSSQTVARFRRGDETMNVKTIIRLAAALGLKPQITFVPIAEEPAGVVGINTA